MAQYQREKGFTFFGSFEELLEKIGKVEGEELELKCWRAIARYGLYKEKPTDAKVDMLITQLYENIDYSQARREDGFRSGRSQTYDYKAIQRMREEGKSLKEIERATGASRSTVKRAVKKNEANDGEGAITNDAHEPSGLYNNSNNINTMDNGGALKAPPKREYIAYKDKSDAEYESESDNDTDTEYDNDIDTEYEPEDDYKDDYKDDTDNDYNDEYEYNRGLMNPFEPYEPQYDIPRDREFESLMEDNTPF